MPYVAWIPSSTPTASPQTSLGLPGDAAGVPADEAMRGDECGDALEEGAVVAAVDHELSDAIAAVDDRDLHAGLSVRSAGLRAEHELARLGEEDPGPGAAAALDERADDLAQEV